jgi:hypothetical protein
MMMNSRYATISDAWASKTIAAFHAPLDRAFAATDIATF